MVKRAFDLVIIVALFPLWAVAMVALFLLLRVTYGAPVFFFNSEPDGMAGLFKLLNFVLWRTVVSIRLVAY